MEQFQCFGCKELLPISEFHKDKSRRNGHREKCKSCRCKYPVGELEKICIACGDAFSVEKANAKAQKYCGLDCQRLYIRYGISEYELEDKLIQSDYKCMICKKDETSVDTRTNKVFELSIDHCHKNGNVRGVLCSSCNKGLGNFKDDTALLQRAIKYLQNNTKKK